MLFSILMGLLRAAPRDQDRSQLVVASLAGDAESARALVALLTPVVRSRAASALLRRGRRAGRSIDQELEDMTQDVLLGLFEQGGKRLASWSAALGTLESFVGVVAEREVASILRSGRRSPWKDEPSSEDEVERQQEPTRSDDARIASRHLLERLLDRMRERLSPQGLQMFYALYMEERSVEVVCGETGMRPDAVYAWRSRLSRLARALADEIENEPQVVSEKAPAAAFRGWELGDAMKNDPLLLALGKVAAEQSAERARWEASSAEAPSEGPTDEREDLARRLFAPASAESIERIAARVTSAIAAPAQPVARVVPMRARAARWAGLAAVPLAAAAAIALLVTRPAGDLPAYEVSVSGGLRAERGADTRAPSDPVVVAAGTQLVLVARPEATAAGSVHVATFVVRSGVPTAVPSTSETSAKGAVRVTVLGDEIAKIAGSGSSAELVLVVDRAEAIDPRALAAHDGTTREWTRFTVPVRVSESGH